jgi:PAS domain S-box-containing protein
LACAPDGNVFAASEPFQPFSVSDRRYFQDALKSLDFSTGEFTIGRISKVNSLHYAIPVLDVKKKLVAVLIAGFNLHEFGRFLSMVNLPEGSAVVFTDHKMVRIYRMPEHEATPLGKLSLFKSYFDSIPGSIAEGLFEWRALDGVMRINAFKKLRLREDSPPYLYIMVGLPKEAIIHEANLKMLRNLLILGLASLLALSLAWILGNKFIINPLNRLVAATQQFGRGNLDTRTGLPHTRDELGRLAQSFDDMATLLEKRNRERQEAEEALSHACDELEKRVQERTAELSASNEVLQLEIDERKQAEEALRESEKTLRALLDANPESVLLFDNSLTVITANKTAAQRLGQSLDDIIGVRLLDLIPTEVMNRRTPYFDQVFRTGKTVQFEDVRAGNHFYTHIYPILDTAGKVSKVATLGIDITERKMAEEVLRQTSETLQTLINIAPLAIYVFDPEGRVQLWNKASERIFGWSEEEALGRLAPFISEDKLEEFGSILGRSLKGEPSSRIELTCRKKDGSPVEISLRTTPLNDEHGKVTAVMAISADITERKRNEEALQESEKKYRLLVNQIPAVVFKGHPDWSVDFFDEKVEALTGYPKEDFDSRRVKWRDLIPAEDLDYAQRVFIEALKTNKSYVREHRIRRKDGGIRWVQCRGQIFCSDEGQVKYISGVTFDITAHKQAEEALRESEEKYRALIDDASEGILLADLKGNLLEANKKMIYLLGYSLDELLGLNLVNIHPAEELERIQAAFEDNIVNHYGQLNNTLLLCRDGKKIPVDITGTLVRYAGKAVIQAIYKDISERRKIEEERLLLSKLESLGGLAGGIAHDFNNILTAILGNIGLAILEGQIAPKVLDRLSQAEQACLRAQALSRQLLTFAKGGTPIKKIISIGKLLKESVGLNLSGSKSRGELSIPDDLWSVEADEGQISQVISNLLINADQAMPGGGVIKIKAENILVEDEPNLPIAKGKCVKLTITDEGTGISSKYLDKIFDPYFSTKQKGSGLGLTTAYSIIKNHNGHISVESQLGVGTTFQIYFPPSEAGALADPAKKAKPVRGQGMVLVMDDDEMVRKVLSGMLSHLGYEVDFAVCGSKALEKFIKARESGRSFDVMILDLTVPGEMGGKETIEKLREIDPHVTAIVSSGYSDDPIMADFQKYGFSGVITKPYRVIELSKILQEVINKRAN